MLTVLVSTFGTAPDGHCALSDGSSDCAPTHPGSATIAVTRTHRRQTVMTLMRSTLPALQRDSHDRASFAAACNIAAFEVAQRGGRDAQRAAVNANFWRANAGTLQPPLVAGSNVLVAIAFRIGVTKSRQPARVT